MHTAATLERTSKLLALVLRHAPQEIGLELDHEGWARIDVLLACAATHGRQISDALLREVVAGSAKQRYAISADGLSIRANQGHSIKTVDLGLVAVVPPALLYHGTATRFVNAIQDGGLLPGSRQHVHLSSLYETAVSVGARHGKPVVLTVRAAAFHAEGGVFFQSDNGVWLTAAVPVAFIDFP